jgi:hypothetical protein
MSLPPPTKDLKVCLLGDTSVGKSSLVIRFTMNEFNVYQESTVGASFLSKTIVVDDRPYKLQIWDTAGQEKVSRPTSTLVRTAGSKSHWACLLVIRAVLGFPPPPCAVLGSKTCPDLLFTIHSIRLGFFHLPFLNHPFHPAIGTLVSRTGTHVLPR